MSNEEIIESLSEFEKRNVKDLEPKQRELFYAIMDIAEQRDELLRVLDTFKKWLNEQTDKTALDKLIEIESENHD